MCRTIHLFLTICAAAAAPLLAQGFHRNQSAASPSGHKVIWILGEDGRLSAFDGVTFHLRTRIAAPLPPDASSHPGSISISQTGLVLYPKPVANSGPPRLWRLWSDGHSRELIAATDRTQPAPGGRSLVTRSTPVACFSADGRRIFWFEDTFTALQRGNVGEINRTGKFLVWTTNLDGHDPKPLVGLGLPRCTCGTGVCEETCPELVAWSPPAGFSDFFFLTRWIPGQVSSQILETDLYQAGSGRWIAHKLSAPVDTFLDAADHGHVFIGAIPDAGCCGWENESDDLTYLVRDGHRLTVFDERARFHNKDYDVSFFTANALLSPGANDVAYTIASTYKPGQPIRLSAGGKANPAELRQIQAAIPRLPEVEVEAVSHSSRPRLTLPNTELIGWLDARRLLVWRHGRLLAVNAASGQAAPTGLAAAKPADVFLP